MQGDPKRTRRGAARQRLGVAPLALFSFGPVDRPQRNVDLTRFGLSEHRWPQQVLTLAVLHLFKVVQNVLPLVKLLAADTAVGRLNT